MAHPVYYPQYHSRATVVDPHYTARMPSALIQTPSTPHSSFYPLPTWIYPLISPKQAEGMTSPAVPLGKLPGTVLATRTQPFTGAAKLAGGSGGRLVAPSSADTSGATHLCAAH